MLRKPQNTDRLAKVCAKSVQFSDSIRRHSPPALHMSREENDTKSTNSLCTSFFFSEPDFDKEVETLLKEFDEKCSKLWEEEDRLFQQSLGSEEPKPFPLTKPKPETPTLKSRPVFVSTTTSSSDNNGTYRSELYLKDFPQKKRSPNFVGVFKREKSIGSDKFEIDIDVTGFE